ncbi:MAG: hypothetical protein GDA44_03780 [Prochloron sp. SP5CPC1]|nr:hypothetical protein [Candidatus Paraprochloron terpiosi SP5CPC1]
MQNIKIPPLYCPFPGAIHQNVATAQEQTNKWVRRFHLLPDELAYRRFRAAQFPRMSARTRPHASPEIFAIITNFYTWLFILDDYCEDLGINKHPELLPALHSRSLAILRGEKPTHRDAPLVQALADIRRRVEPHASSGWMDRFTSNMEDYLQALVWQAANHTQGITPDLATYLKMRSFLSAVYPSFDFIEIEVSKDMELPNQVRANKTVQKLKLIANNVVSWSNDIIGLEKEMELGDVHNLVLVLQREHQLTLQEAINRAAELCNEEVRKFMDLESRLPSFGPVTDPKLQHYVLGLRSWMRGWIDWALETERYQPNQKTNNLQINHELPVLA